jgi:hypothetical protein
MMPGADPARAPDVRLPSSGRSSEPGEKIGLPLSGLPSRSAQSIIITYKCRMNKNTRPHVIAIINRFLSILIFFSPMLIIIRTGLSLIILQRNRLAFTNIKSWLLSTVASHIELFSSAETIKRSRKGKCPCLDLLAKQEIAGVAISSLV